MNDSERVKKLADQDEHIFQTARLINCSWFGSVIFSDYFGAILGLVRQGSTWTLNPFAVCGSLGSSSHSSLADYATQEIRDLDHQLFERGRGNVCSVEVCICGADHITDPLTTSA
jgi:linoleate 10R-lipoxygenase